MVLCKLIAKDEALKAQSGEKDGVFSTCLGDSPQVLFVTTTNEWSADIAYYLTYGEFPPHLDYKQRRTLKLKATKFVIWYHALYKRGMDGCFLRCIDKERREKLLRAYHDQACGGHFSAMVTAHKILRGRYYWRSIFVDTHDWVSKCKKIFVDNATYFSSKELTEFCYGFGISLSQSSDYYPQGNGQAESSNKNIVTIVRKLVDENQRNWHNKLYDALWVDRINPKKAISYRAFNHKQQTGNDCGQASLIKMATLFMSATYTHIPTHDFNLSRYILCNSRNLHDKISIKYKHVRCALGSGDDMQNIQALDEFKGVSENGNFELTARDSNTLPRSLSILDLSVPVNQRSQLRVAYQGVPGAFSEDAAAKAYPKCEAGPCEQFETAFEAVELGLVDRAVLPIENSLGGSIHRNYDLLLRPKLHIVGEVQFPVHHCLLGVRGVKEELRRVLSHPQALSQCEHTLSRLGVIRDAVDDTAGAAQFVALHKLYDTGAVASARAAKIYGLDILAKDIQDVSGNVTRFLMLAREPIIPRVDRPFKTSIVFTLEGPPGVLFKALAVFAMREINLTKIESLPQRKRPLRVTDGCNNGSAMYFDCLFYVDFEASMADARKFAMFMRVLGSYPMDASPSD
ncbi:hypothetical protein KI387_003693 [Taxus chinensis]|uniref:arogenate dehydratase n=1 Tax=Taxus chinensis TaxID=29808 RepID=A0AA38H150_TAXCH|nr:hypothetical protein KI387_003693 [Taxus chinensis]